MEIPKYEEFKQKELYKIRRFQNSKMEIFQYSNEPLIRPKTTTQEYKGSYEEKRILDSCYNIISNISNLLYLSINEEKPIQVLKHSLRKYFNQNEIVNREYDNPNIEMNHINFMKKIKFDRIKNELEYKELCKFIESPEFDYIMKTKRTIAKWILTHEYLIYHPDNEFIKKKYSIVLCPSYTYHEENGSNEEDISNQENNNNEPEYVDYYEEDSFYEEDNNVQEEPDNRNNNEHP
jgi:hypothetical protein